MAPPRIIWSSNNNRTKTVLNYRELQAFDKYTLFEIELETGRHHQIRVQMSSRGFIVKGDVKYGANRANPDKSISLHARALSFNHPVTKERIALTATPPQSDAIWRLSTKK